MYMCVYILDVDYTMKMLDHVTVSSIIINQQHTVSIIILHSCVYIIHETIIVVNQLIMTVYVHVAVHVIFIMIII